MSFKDILSRPFVKPENSVKERKLFVSVDIGSTETRCIVRNPKTNKTSEVLTVDTGQIIIPRKLEGIYTEPAISSNLEAIISGTINTHIIKGDMRNFYNRPQKVLASCASKLEQEQTYISITFIIGLAIALYEIDCNEKADVTNVTLMLSLPSEDVGSDIRKAKVDSKLKTAFNVEFPRFPYNVNFEVKEINLYSEVYAAAVCYSLIQKISPVDNYVFVDCGGRNRGAIVYNNGRLASEAAITSNGGGDNYLKELCKIIQNRTELSSPNKQSVIRALETAVINNGSTSIDISECLDEAKELLSEDLLDTVLMAVDYNNLQLNEVHTIVCTGRTMLPSKLGDRITSPSVVEKLETLIKGMCPTVRVIHYDFANPIVNGLNYLSYKFK